MADAPTRFPWMREQIAKYQDVTAQTFSQGKYARPAPRSGNELFQSFLRHAGHMLWSIPSSLAEGTINWLDYPQKGHAIGSPAADLEVTRGAEDYRPSHMGAPEILAPLGMGVGGALAQLGKSGTQLGVFGGKVTARNLERQGRPIMSTAIEIAEGMEKKGFSEAEIIEAVNPFIARNDPMLGGISKFGDDWKVELGDAASRLTPSGKDVSTLGRELTHPELFRAHPELREMPFRWVEGQGGTFYPPTGRLGLGSIEIGRASPDPLAVVLHEVQHAIAGRNKHAGGADPLQIGPYLQELARVDPAKRARIREEALSLQGKWKDEKGRVMSLGQIERMLAYRNTAGEVEARNVERRIPLTPHERREQHPRLTQDVPDYDHIVIKGARLQRALDMNAPPSVKLQELRHFKAPNGTIETMAYNVLDADGTIIAKLRATYFPAAKEFKISDIEVVGFERGQSANVLTPRQFRELLREIKRRFPKARDVTGIRASGVRGKRGEGSGKVDKFTDPETDITKFTIPKHFKSETGLPPLELLPRSNESPESKEGKGKQKTPAEAKEPAKKEDPRGEEPLELEREPDVWLDEEGRPNIRIRPQRQSQIRPWQADRHATRNVMRRVKVVAVDDRPEIQEVTVEGLADEEIKLPLRGQPHGLSSNPRPGAVGYAFLANGRPDQAFLMGLEHPEDRVKDAKEGESHQYAAKSQRMAILKNGNLQHHTPKGRVYINSDV